MADEAPSHPRPNAARFFVLTDGAAPQWPAGLQALLNNPTPFAAKSAEGLSKALDMIDAALKAAGVVDEVILLFGTAEVRKADWQSAGELAGVSKLVEKLAYRVQMYQPDGKPPPQVTLVTPPPVGSKAGEAYTGANERIADLAKSERETALSVGTKLVDVLSPMKGEIDTLVEADGVKLNAAGEKRVAELIAAVFADRAAPAPPTDVRIAGQKVMWTASPSKDVIGYEIHNVDDESTLLTTSVTTEATLPEGHDTCAVLARDAVGRVSEGAKPDK
jgi:lysophospholipase L1-like esterase